jgi:uncharacterized protein (TIGR02231 family)
MAQTVATEVVRVLVHPGVAAVERVGATSITVGGALHLAALPVGLDDDSVQVGIVGPAEVRAVRVELAAVATVDAGAADAEVVAARAALAQRRAERDAVTQGLAALAALAPVEPRAELPTLPDWDAVVAARAALVELGRQRLAAGRERLAALAEELADAERAVAAAEERRARASSSTRAAGELYKVVVAIVLPRGEGGAVTVTCRYRIAGARWAPTYVARLIDGQVQLERRAVVAQATGEDWRGVALELSTAAPTRRVALPELPALRIGRAQPTPAKAGWRAPPEGIDELYRDWDQAFASAPAHERGPASVDGAAAGAGARTRARGVRRLRRGPEEGGALRRRRRDVRDGLRAGRGAGGAAPAGEGAQVRGAQGRAPRRVAASRGRGRRGATAATRVAPRARGRRRAPGLR